MNDFSLSSLLGDKRIGESSLEPGDDSRMSFLNKLDVNELGVSVSEGGRGWVLCGSKKLNFQVCTRVTEISMHICTEHVGAVTYPTARNDHA